ncbi:glycosyltransferase family 4 protein [Lewinella cohaerens]|uniref:glycosyltransferase family 4 protein n=1 Tax=Lewinella cohaerens TaxID=70995 RepID=UPI000376D849|nr:glycosyltransferase family 4 protein [Lewinella cohaerens]
MKFLFVLEHFSPYLGGAEKLFHQVTSMLVQEGHEVEVVTTLFRADLPATEIIEGVQVRRVKCHNRFLFTLLSLPVLFRAAKRADIIHTTTYNAAFPAWLVAKFWRKPSVITYHEHWGELWFQLPFLAIWQRWLYFLFEKMISRLSFDHYIAVSEATKSSLIVAGIAPGKIHRIYNGIDYDRFQAIEANKTPYFSIIYYGRLGVSKGLDLLIPAWGAFARKHSSKQLVLRLVLPTYPPSLLAIIKKLIATHCPPESVVVFHELTTEELFTTVKSSHAVVIPSYSEGFCFVAAEAVALDMPIISSGRGALPEVVSGQHLHLPQLGVVDLEKALAAAKKGDWQCSSSIIHTLTATTDNYLKFYQQLTWHHEGGSQSDEQ